MSHPEELLAKIPEHLHEAAAEVTSARLERLFELLENRVNGVIVAAEAVHRRHNVSAILRSAESFGLHEAHLIAQRFKPSRGASRGAERWLDVQMFEETKAWAAEVKGRGYRVYVADLSEDSVAPDELPVDVPIAILFGGEMAGVSPEAREIADGVVTIPMRGVTQSLNVSVAAAVTLWSVAQRRREVPGALGIPEERRGAFVERFLRRELKRRRTAKVWIEG